MHTVQSPEQGRSISVFSTTIPMLEGHLAAREYSCFLRGQNTSQVATIARIPRKKPSRM